MRTYTVRAGWFVGLMLAAGCTVDNSAAIDETGADQGAPAGGAGGEVENGGAGGQNAGGSGGATGGQNAGGNADAGPIDEADQGAGGGAQLPDAAPPPDAGPSPCDDACQRLGECALSDCPDIGRASLAALRTACDATCAGNPAFATVVEGSSTCADVIEFALSRGEDLPGLADACGPPVEPPPAPDGGACRITCAEETEVCLEGHCVRVDHSCDGDIHCRTGVERCVENACVASEFAPCRGSDECAADQFCLIDPANPLAGGSCVFDCGGGQACPFNERCFPEFGGACYYDFCGGDQGNGEPMGACQIGGPAGNPGTCFPLPASNGAGIGICLEAGVAAEGAACDLQVEGRDEAARAVQCAPGSYCWGDYDDGELPPASWNQIGACAGLCDPRNPTCSEGRECVDLSNGDDPATPEDDTRVLGICLPLDCDLFPADDGPPACADGEACRLVAVGLVRGECGPAGPVAPGEPCATSDECAGVAFCGQGGGLQTECLQLCDPAIEPARCATPGQICYAEMGWSVGFCIDAPMP